MIALAHIPVLVKEVIEHLISEKFNIFIDATVGGGGHASSILRHNERIKLIGFDVDEYALNIAKKTLEPFGERVTLVKGNFRNLKTLLNEMGIDTFDGILFDLGLSMYQIAGKRGFSFYDNNTLDMRMDMTQENTAFKVINSYDFETLRRIIKDYGEEFKANVIAKAIVNIRKKRPIQTASELADLITGIKGKRGRLHPATKTFQAVRIEVNRELENLSLGLKDAIEMCAPKGRIGVISFHSLEDRIVKNMFRHDERLNVITKKPITPSKEEIKVNPPSRSAKLRIAEKL
ncbi:MAG TPA: 16S rRNA (cytosine(1402)-N(4))-methyltransferase RsmH [Syntrophorhabdaceae bacterium]|nr:16S rRNA (cytosine(1402)-N(4))-methyltransferase RsmH [Syntrophorhabdaceae bacterium]